MTWYESFLRLWWARRGYQSKGRGRENRQEGGGHVISSLDSVDLRTLLV